MTYGQHLSGRILTKETHRQIAAARHEIEQWRKARFALAADMARLDEVRSEQLPPAERIQELLNSGYMFNEQTAAADMEGMTASQCDAYCKALRSQSKKRYTPRGGPLCPIEISNGDLLHKQVMAEVDRLSNQGKRANYKMVEAGILKSRGR